MRLNPDCIRDILLHFEKITDGVIVYDVDESNSYEYLDNYSSEEFMYHIRQCYYNCFFIGEDRGSYINIKDLSPIAHSFLADTRLDNNWNKIKGVAKTLGISSLTALTDIATKHTASLVANYFQKL